MITCNIIDETDRDEHQNIYNWQQGFPRVPTIGEYIVKDQKGFKVKSVLWYDHGNTAEVTLVVEWDGWLQ